MTQTIKIELDETDVRAAIAHYINSRPHWIKNQHVYDSDVKIEVAQSYVDRPGDPGLPKFSKAVVTINVETDYTDNGTSPDDKG